MRSPSRYGIASSLSVVAHTVVLFWGVWNFRLDLDVQPEFEFEFETVELVDPDQTQGQQSDLGPTPLVGPPPPTAKPEEEGPKEAEPEEKKKEREFGEKGSKISRLGPTNSTFYLLLANKKIARLPFAEEIIEIIAPLPDFRYLIQGGGFHALRDFEYIVLASPDVRDITQTFLAVQHRIPTAEIKAGIGRAAKARKQVLNWEQRNGLEMVNPRPASPSKEDRDPRWFVLMPDNIALYIREEFLPQVLEGPDKKKGKTSGNFVAQIAKMRRFTRQEPRAGLQLVFSDMHAALRSAKLPWGMPFPNNLEVMAEAARSPEIIVKLGFVEAASAKQAARVWREDLRKFVDANLAIKLFAGSMYASTKVEERDRSMVLRNRFDEGQAKTILHLIAGQSRRIMRRSDKDMDEARRAREEIWAERKEGKLTPSKALEIQQQRSRAAAEAHPPPPGAKTATQPAPPRAGPPPHQPLQPTPALDDGQ
ncbi:MAG: hypothetical protein V3V08_07835 [Nannocystaceae bacterium]